MKYNQLTRQLLDLRRQALQLEREYAPLWQALPASQQPSARNFLHYLAVRQQDIRPLQQQLSSLGLSSLGLLEPNVLEKLNTVLDALAHLAGTNRIEHPATPVSREAGLQQLQQNANTLLGIQPESRQVRIMVTMPAEAAHDKTLLQQLVEGGMDIMRINCAHDTPADWLSMIANLREASATSGRPCLIQADLAGPKLRTGPIASSGRVLKIKPKRDVFGHVTVPAPVWFTPAANPELPPSTRHAVVEVSGDLLALAQAGDRVLLCDTRGDEVEFILTHQDGTSWLAETGRTTYIEQHTSITLWRRHSLISRSTIENIPEIILPIVLTPGDTLVLTRDATPGKDAEYDAEGRLVSPAHIHCSLSSAFDQVTAGESVWLDDGKIGGVVQSCDANSMHVRITHAAPEGSKLKAEKGINFPDTHFRLPALTEKDKADLQVLLPHVDMVALSFLRSPDDVEQLHAFLHAQRHPDKGVVLKIENRQAFEQLPLILLTSMQYPPFGVMVARGDLAVEMGFDRLSEVQEEILWLCEAAHVPVIWATQILEGMAKKGAPSRAEVSDAAMSIRAECAMLNKGPHIVETVRFLSGIIGRMESHYAKRRTTLRKLSVASSVFSETK